MSWICFHFLFLLALLLRDLFFNSYIAAIHSFLGS